MSKLNIVVCMGSSCFARGNQENLAFIEEYIETGSENNSFKYFIFFKETFNLSAISKSVGSYPFSFIYSIFWSAMYFNIPTILV